jgi:exo-beta-1,3-glucanase (GH17 family)
MNLNQKSSLFAGPLMLARAAVALTAAALLTACGGGGSVAVDAPQSAVATTNLRALPAEFLARKAVSYSPFRTGDRANEKATLSDADMKAHITEDLNLLVAGNFKLIRLFDSSDEVAKRTLEVIKRDGLDIKVQLGAYVNSYKYVYNPPVISSIKAENQAELNRLIALATNPDYKDIILAVSVGNETMVSWSPVPIDPEDMAGYISYVRAQVKQPVTTDDNFVFFAEIPKRISDLIDFASIHTYAEIDTQYPDSPYYWDWRQEGVALAGTDKTARAAAMMNAAMVATRAQYQMVRDSLDRKGLRNVPIVIGETGWNAVDVGKLRFRASPVNQKMYFTRLETWRAEGRVGPGPANVFYFEAFDEPWKGGDDKWGLFNVARQARCVVQALSTAYTAESGSCADSAVNAFVAPVPATAFGSTQFAVFSDAAGVTQATGYGVGGFSDGAAGYGDIASTADKYDGAVGMNVIRPTNLDFGWGVLFYPQTAYQSVNLASYAAAGKVNFWIKTDYPGKLEIGLSTDTVQGEAQEAYLQIASGSYGYVNDNTWHQVSIPLQAFVAANPKIDFSMVLNPFVIADRYSYTGKPNGSNFQNLLYVDGIIWTK